MSTDGPVRWNWYWSASASGSLAVADKAGVLLPTTAPPDGLSPEMTGARLLTSSVLVIAAVAPRSSATVSVRGTELTAPNEIVAVRPVATTEGPTLHVHLAILPSGSLEALPS